MCSLVHEMQFLTVYEFPVFVWYIYDTCVDVAFLILQVAPRSHQCAKVMLSFLSFQSTAKKKKKPGRRGLRQEQHGIILGQRKLEEVWVVHVTEQKEGHCSILTGYYHRVRGYGL
jgi:hypothetical protein